DAVRARAAAHGAAGEVEFPGWVEGEAKELMFAHAGIYALPSYMEALPRGILEAMAAGLPIVASRIGGIPDVIEDGVNGILIRPGDIDGLVDALLGLIEAPERRAAMGIE